MLQIKSVIKISKIPGLNFILTSDARFVYKRLISDARIKKMLKGQIKFEVEDQSGPNIPKSYAKYSYGNLFLR